MTVFKHCKSWLGALAVVTTMGLVLAGCGAIREAATRDKVLREEMKQFTYAAPIEKVWPEAKVMFAQRGMDVTEDTQDRGTGAFLFTTRWQVVQRSGSSTVERHRYAVRGVKLDGGSQIEITKITQHMFSIDESWRDVHSSRDSRMELELVKRVEPGRAQEISAKAAAAGQEARKGE